MDARLQKRVQRYGWDKAALLYENAWERQLAPAQQRLLEMAGLQPGEQVLDVACGTGLVTFPAAQAVGDDGTVTGTDISQGMIDLARQIAAQRLAHQLSFLRMDGENLQFPDASFDAVLCALGLLYFPDPQQSLREMRRVLKPGGRAVSAVWGRRSHCGWAEIFPIVDARVKSEVCPMFFHLGTGEVLAQHYRMAGFGDIRCERISATLHYDSAESACDAAFAGGPVAMAYARFDEITRQEARAEYLASIAPYRQGNGYEIPGEFVVVSGRKVDI